jgi:hypothetical protein
MSGEELLTQAQLWLGFVVKKFTSTSDCALESMALDSALLAQEPISRPSLPSAIYTLLLRINDVEKKKNKK